MIVPRRRPPSAAGGEVAGHYDALDPYYRAVWGEHVHHGLWTTGRETPGDATDALVDHVALRAELAPGAAVCDVGCGYGGTARRLAAEHGAEVTGLTISRAQYAHASARGAPPAAPAPTYLLRSWLENGLPDASFAAVLAIESLSHMDDLERAFAECARVLRPGGRLVVADWLTRDEPRAWEETLLLAPICAEGRLPAMGSAPEYEELMARSGLVVDRVEDLSTRVRRTWTVVARRLGALLVRDRAARRFLLSAENPDRAFGLSLLRIPLAYRTGSMRYGVLSARRPA